MPSDPVSNRATIRPLRFATRELQALRQLRELNERSAVLPLQPLPDVAVHADIVQWPYPRLGILSARLGGVRHGAEYTGANDDHLYLGITLQGRSVAEAHRGELTLQDGDAVLLSAPLGLWLSRAALAAHLRRIDDAVMRPIRRDTPALRLLTRYVGIALDGSLPAPELRSLVVGHVYELAAAAIGTERDRTWSADGFGIRAARLAAIKADIVAHLGDADLGAATIAARHRVTPRYVHKLFAADGTTCSEFIIGQRLARVHRMLCDPRCAGVAISTLAYDAGFGDLSYFNRSFRRHYGATPSDVRRGG
jgi:AraC-like DNA-binding protein